MRCTLLNSLERHLSPICRGLTLLCEPAKHRTRSLIRQRVWLMIVVKKWKKRTKEEKKADTVSFFFMAAFWSRRGMKWSEPVDKATAAEGLYINERHRHMLSPCLLWIHHLFPLPPPLLSFYLGPSIKATFCSWGSYGASGLCHSPHPLWISTKRHKSSVLSLLIEICLRVVSCWSIERLDRARFSSVSGWL